MNAAFYKNKSFVGVAILLSATSSTVFPHEESLSFLAGTFPATFEPPGSNSGASAVSFQPGALSRGDTLKDSH